MYLHMDRISGLGIVVSPVPGPLTLNEAKYGVLGWYFKHHGRWPVRAGKSIAKCSFLKVQKNGPSLPEIPPLTMSLCLRYWHYEKNYQIKQQNLGIFTRLTCLPTENNLLDPRKERAFPNQPHGSTETGPDQRTSLRMRAKTET